ncbi:hypothetical protein [Streptomyces sp. NBC_01237]|nr:hypothetical protein [Streptomyces sp. NBC_01237]WRZ77711.1 hypothetical protein OG251_39590 [Streptomyces sp. NBC_01237]
MPRPEETVGLLDVHIDWRSSSRRNRSEAESRPPRSYVDVSVRESAAA